MITSHPSAGRTDGLCELSIVARPGGHGVSQWPSGWPFPILPAGLDVSPSDLPWPLDRTGIGQVKRGVKTKEQGGLSHHSLFSGSPIRPSAV